MLTVTDKASEMIQDFLKDRPAPKGVRILLMEGG